MMDRLGKILLFLVLVAQGYAQAPTFDLSIKQARTFFDAGDYGRARSQYEVILDDSLPVWQQAILWYDSGTTLLAQREWQKALTVFQQVSALNPNAPLLKQYLTTNQAFGMLQLSRENFAALRKIPSPQPEDVIHALFLIQQTLRQITSAQKAACVLDQVEGLVACAMPERLCVMYQQAKELLSTFLHNSTPYRLVRMSWNEAIATLLAGEKALAEHLDFLVDSHSDQSIRVQYLPIYVKEGESWYVLWHAAEGMIPSVDTMMEKFHEAEDAYISVLSLMRAGEIEKGQEVLKGGIALLEEVLQESFGSDSLQKTLQWLLARYAIALTFDPIQETALDAIDQIQQKLEVLLGEMKEQTSAVAAIHQKFLRVEELFHQGQKELALAHLLQARMFIEGAYGILDDLVEQDNDGRPKSVEDILKKGISTERRALMLSHLRQQVIQEEESLQGIDLLVLQAQQRVIEHVSPFFLTVVHEQQELFQTEGCQCHRWREEVSLFIKGWNAAMEANLLLENDPMQLVRVAELQEKAIKAWKEALAHQRKQRQQQEEKTSSQDSQQSSKATSTAPVELKDLLKSLQEMERDDQSKSEIKTSPSSKGVQRPW